jgi:hypothetical protein
MNRVAISFRAPEIPVASAVPVLGASSRLAPPEIINLV